MNIKKLANIVHGSFIPGKESALIILSREWEKHAKCGNPVKAAVKCNRLMKIAKSFMCVALALLGISLVTNLLDEQTFSVTCAVLTFLSVAVSLGFYRLSRSKNYDDARRFCESISLLENLAGKFEAWDYRSKWNVRDGTGQLQNAAFMVLQAQAAKVKQLQEVPWKDKETTKARALFGKKISLLHNLLSVPLDWDRYFKAADMN